MEQNQPPVDLTTSTLPLNHTDTETVFSQHIDREDSASPVSEHCLDRSEEAEQETDIFHGSESLAPQEQGLDDECVISSSEGVSSFVDSPTASSLVTCSIDYLQSEGLEAQKGHSPSPETLPPQAAQAVGDEDRCTINTQVSTHTQHAAGGSPKHTHTHTWVQQQQQLSQSSVSPADGPTNHEEEKTQEEEEEEEDEFDSLAKDFDQSLDQLNQLILDLDPEFEPNPTPMRGHMTRSASLYTNGVSRTHSSDFLYRQASDVTDYPGFLSPVGDFSHVFSHQSPLYSPSFTQLYRSDSIEYEDHSPLMDSPQWAGSGHAPPTPAFPVCPPTPYGNYFINASA
ncbi:hypothetical protein ACEWY4_014091 [Coilia grayii]|uniref:Uncharacterized protein n=1 Tax=Coilia grayii TaxID=363190 RepID=A0ABD1JRH1_9TELE